MPELQKDTDDLKDKDPKVESGQSDTENADEKLKDGGEDMVPKAEVQKMADAMVAKKLKGMPSKEELAKYKEWQESQKTEAERQADEQKRVAAIEAENTTLKQEKAIIRKGVKADDVDYVLFKVNKMEGEDFDDKLESFLTDNPKFIEHEDGKKDVKTDGVGVKHNTTSTSNSSVQDFLKARHPNIKLED